MIESRNAYKPSEVSPPGETLRDLLDERGISQADLSARMGRPQKTISEIVNGKAAITTETALELELVLGVPAAFWLSREAQFRESLARTELAAHLDSSYEWSSRFPVKVMERLGWLPKTTNRRSQVRALLEFFGVASAEQWEAVHQNFAVAFRHSRRFSSDLHALSAWLRAGVREAQRSHAHDYDRDAFLNALQEARGLTNTSPTHFALRLSHSMAAAGVVVAFVPELPKSRASGATQWISPSKALIQLSLRYKTNDHLWFTFFHEAAHVLLHSKKAIFIEQSGGNGPEEEEANEWASNFLIPQDQYASLATWPTYPRASIIEFSRQIGIAPGIVVGRLQHDGLLPHSHLNDLKQRLVWVAVA